MLIGMLIAASLGWVFVWSGANKIVQPGPAALAMVNFGVGDRYRRINGVRLGLAECLLAAALLISSGVSRTALIGAVVLMAGVLAMFAALIGTALRNGASFSCACFGGQGESISRRTLYRSLSLTLAAVGSAWLLATSSGEAHPLVVFVASAATVGSGGLLWQFRFLLTANALPIDSKPDGDFALGLS